MKYDVIHYKTATFATELYKTITECLTLNVNL